MQLQNLFVSAISFCSLASAVPSNHASLHPRQVPVRPCSHTTGGVHVIATPGEGTSNPPYGLLITLATMILQRIPGSTNVSVPYDHTQKNGVIQSQQAAQNLTNYIAEYHESCPKTKIVLLGYSSGAIATMNVLCGESSPPYSMATSPLPTATYGSSIIANVVYGDETRTAGNTWDFGTCTNNGSHPRQNPAGCDAWANKIRSYCDTADPLCCAGGTDMEAHYSYPMKYDKTAADFVMRRLTKAGGA